MKSISKNGVLLLAGALLAFAAVIVAGCASQNNEAASSSASSAAASDATATGETASLANPWSQVASAQEAAQGAGLDSFTVPEGEIADLGAPFEIGYSYMQGMAQARLEFPASAVTLRKSVQEGSEGTDNSGDYNTYANEWTEDINGIQVTCAGNREGEATKAYWNANGADYSMVAQGLGGDDDFGLTTERLTVVVEGTL